MYKDNNVSITEMRKHKFAYQIGKDVLADGNGAVADSYFEAYSGNQSYEDIFEAAFNDPDNFSKTDLAKKWHVFASPQGSAYHFCFSPHDDTKLSLNPIGAAIDQASSSVLFAVAFLNQAKSGAARKSIDRLMERPVFSYGISDKSGGLQLKKPDGS